VAGVDGAAPLEVELALGAVEVAGEAGAEDDVVGALAVAQRGEGREHIVVAAGDAALERRHDRAVAVLTGERRERDDVPDAGDLDVLVGGVDRHLLVLRAPAAVESAALLLAAGHQQPGLGVHPEVVVPDRVDAGAVVRLAVDQDDVGLDHVGDLLAQVELGVAAVVVVRADLREDVVPAAADLLREVGAQRVVAAVVLAHPARVVAHLLAGGRVVDLAHGDALPDALAAGRGDLQDGVHVVAHVFSRWNRNVETRSGQVDRHSSALSRSSVGSGLMSLSHE
jgi:hypothetical protein